MKKAFRKTLAICIAAFAACLAFSACDKIADNTEHFDKVTKTLKLSKEYEGKNLMSDDGIGVATMPGETTDGDTTTFKLASDNSFVRVRYQGVDTPESTAGVEKWGKAASIFTNERLKMATEIVLESASGGIPEKDSVGQRSLCYVWYKTEKDDFKLLNLELVENGYSLNKESASSGYYGYFQQAEQFARSIELRLFSKLEDPLFDTSVVPFSIKDMQENPDKYAANMKVHLHAYMANKVTSSSGAATFTIAQVDEETGKVYTFQLYAGYARASASKMVVGDMYHIVGTLQLYEDNWQISGVEVDNYDKGNESTERSWRELVSYYRTFDSSSNLYTQKISYNCLSDLKVTEASLEGNILTFTGTAVNTDEETKTFTFHVTVPETYDNAIAAGKTLAIGGAYKFDTDSEELTVLDYTLISIK